MTDASHSPTTTHGNGPRPTIDRARAVKRRVALAVLPPLPPVALGDVQLMPHQRQAAVRLLRALRDHHGALLADAVGLGKTYSALAVARSYGDAHILAPAGLVAMWEAALLRTGLARIPVHSIHRASVTPPAPFRERAQATRPLVIIDEAHMLRNAHTARYRHVAQAVAACDVLLLSATPLHNSPHDLATLFALFRGTHATPLPSPVLERLIVRRDSVTGDQGSRQRAAPPRVRTHRPLTVPQDRGTLERLLALPAPLPARDGAVAGALIRLGLLRAWCSSDAALTQALGVRLQRGAAMRAALEAGRLPTTAELRSCFIGDDPANDMQLGFAELLFTQSVTENEQRSAFDTLGRHCEALRELRTHHLAHSNADLVRAGYLRAICRRHASTPVVAFSQHARTVQALFRALSDIAGVGLLTGSQARIASGPVSRPELLGWFAPRAQGRPPPPDALRVSLLLTTDLIAEGVNLQDAGVVVHLDLPWTHAMRIQRTGRVARLGSTHATAHEYRLRAMRRAREHLRDESRLARKALLAARLVGRAPDRAAAQPEGVRRFSNAEFATAWHDRLWEWATLEGSAEDVAGVPHRRWAELPGAGAFTGVLVLVRTADGSRVLACARKRGRWCVSTRPDALLAVSDGREPARWRREENRDVAVSTGAGEARALSPQCIRRLVYAWQRHRRVHDIAGAGAQTASASALNRAQQQAMQQLRQLVQRLTAVERARCVRAIGEATTVVETASGAGAEEALGRWMNDVSERGHLALSGWQAYPELLSCREVVQPHALPDHRHAVRIEACLVFHPS